MKTTIHIHFNRIKKVIENPKNEVIHLEAIRNLLNNFQAMFGYCKLHNSLIKLETELKKRIL